MTFNWDNEFKLLRRYYAVVRALFQNFHFLLSFILKRHDTLASDTNINPDYWNDHILILRNSYKKAFEVWSKEYIYPSNKRKRANKGKKDITKDEFYEIMYHQLSQKSIRFMLDIISTAALEDTVYRELLAVWMFEIQFQMNGKFNPEMQQYHVVYTNYLRNDKDYFAVMDKFGKQRTMQTKHLQRLKHIEQEHYGKRRMEVDLNNLKRKERQLNEELNNVKRKPDDLR